MPTRSRSIFLCVWPRSSTQSIRRRPHDCGQASQRGSRRAPLRACSPRSWTTSWAASSPGSVSLPRSRRSSTWTATSQRSFFKRCALGPRATWTRAWLQDQRPARGCRRRVTRTRSLSRSRWRRRATTSRAPSWRTPQSSRPP